MFDAPRTPFDLHDFAVFCFVGLGEGGKSGFRAKASKGGITEHRLVDPMVQERVATLARIDFDPAPKRTSNNMIG